MSHSPTANTDVRVCSIRCGLVYHISGTGTGAFEMKKTFVCRNEHLPGLDRCCSQSHNKNFPSYIFRT